MTAENICLAELASAIYSLKGRTPLSTSICPQHKKQAKSVHLKKHQLFPQESW